MNNEVSTKNIIIIFSIIILIGILAFSDFSFDFINLEYIYETNPFIIIGIMALAILSISEIIKFIVPILILIEIKNLNKNTTSKEILNELKKLNENIEKNNKIDIH